MNTDSNSENNIEELDTSEVNLTDWENEPTLADLKQDYTDAKIPHATHVKNVRKWLNNLNITGSAKQPERIGRSSVSPRLIRKQAEWRYASLSEPFLSTPDVFNIDPVTFEDKKAAIQNALVLNNQFNTKIDKVNFFDTYIRTGVDEGSIVVRVAWEFKEEEVEVEIPVYQYIPTNDPIIIKKFQELHRVMQETPEVFASLPEQMQATHIAGVKMGVPVEAIQVGLEKVKEFKQVTNQPSLKVCEYDHIVLDPTADGVMDDANFLVYDFEISMAELESSPEIYKNLDSINVEGSSILSQPDHPSDTDLFNFKDKPRKKMVIHEYWGFKDINGDGVLQPIVAAWIGDVKVRMQKNPMPDKKLPFVLVHYLPVRGENYGEPDGELLEDNQKIIGAVTRGMIDIMGRSANGQIGMRKDALDVYNRRRFDKGLDYEFNATVNPKDLAYTHTYPEIPRSAEYMLGLQNADAESMSGIKSFANSGITGQALGATATGIRSALDATAKRELGILRRMAEGIKQIGRKIISMNAEFLDEVEIVRITNEEFVPIRRDDLAGNFDLNLSISTPEVDNEKAQELSFMMQTLGNTLPLDFTQMLLTDMARLRKMPTLAKKIEQYQPQPDPVGQKKAELEIALLEAKVFNEQAKGAENAQDVKLKEAKTINEEAKARNLNSKSDQQDLDYVEKESGADKDFELSKKDHDRATALDLKTADSIFAGEESNNTGDISPPNSTGTL